MQSNPVLRSTFSTLLVSSALLLISLAGCRKAVPRESDLSGLGEYLSAYMPEVIGPHDPIRIRFARPVGSDSLSGTSVDESLYALSPAVDGAAIWEDAFTLSFTPEKGFKPDADYAFILRLGRLFDSVDADQREITFRFHVRPVSIRISPDLPEMLENDPEHMAVSGSILTSDPVDPADVERVTKFTSSLDLPETSWTHSADNRTHRYFISPVKRQNDDVFLTVSWDGASFASSGTGSQQIRIPGTSTFTVTDASVNQDGSREIRIVFSDFLADKLNTTGLILINGSDKGFTVKQSRHVITLFPDNTLDGLFTLTLDGSIASRSGARIGDTQTFMLSFDDLPPQVELVGKGNIVPNTGEVIFPFKAINLTAVDVEIFEIFENNVLQFLQYSDLYYANGFEAVGRIVGRHRVDLNALQKEIPRNQWNRYAIDLSAYTEVHPGSIYEVRIGFQPSYSLHQCAEPDLRPEPAESEEDATLWRYYYGFDEYSYENQEDPCKREYYTASHFVRRNVLASNLGLLAKAGKDDQLLIFVHDLRSTQPVAGCQIRVYDFQKQLLGEGRTDAEGRCEIKAGRTPGFVLAEHRGERGYLKVTDGNSLSISDFDVDGTTSEKGMRGFVYGERDVWRPGDTMFLNFVLHSEGEAKVSHPVTCTVYNPRGQKRYEHTSQVHVGPVYAFPVATTQADLTGNWRAEFRVGGVTFNKILKVETIKPNRLKIRIDHEGPIEAWKTTTELPLDVQWLHGAPAGGLEARMELTLSPVETRFKGFSNYTFDDPARRVTQSTTTVYDDQLDAEGRTRVSVSNPTQEPYPGKLSASFKTRVFEKGGDFSTDQFSAEWQPYASYAGLSLPENRWGYQELEVSAENPIQTVLVDNSGNGIGKHQISVGVYHADWRWWWNQDQYELAQFNSGQHIGAFWSDTLMTDAQGKAEFHFKPTGYGLYLLRVCDLTSGHCSGDFAYAGYFYGDEEDGRSAAARLTFDRDKEKYQVGDDVQLSIPSSPGSLVLISLESETRVLQTFRLQAEGDLTTYSFKATSEMAPNVYAHVSLIQPHQLDGNDMPLRMYGVIPIMVEDPHTRLQPVLSMPDVLTPEKGFNLTVHEAQGQAMAYTVAIVDEGLLDLTRFKTPDPWNFFFAKQALGVHTWDLYDQVLGGIGGPVERILAIGGDGSNLNIPAVNEVNRFKPVVRHLGPFLLKPGETATHHVEMPNYIGSVRAMLIGSSENQYGAAEKTVPVKHPVMVLATLPRVLSPGEEITIPVNVFAMEDNIRTVDVTIQGNINLIITGRTSQQVTFDRQGDQLIFFTAEVGQVIGKGELRIEARAGNHQNTQQLEIPIRNPNPNMTEVTEALIAPGGSWTDDLTPIGMEGTNQMSIEISHLYPINLQKRLGYLIRYPYGCLEQTTSSAFPQLYVGNLIDLSPAQKREMTGNVAAAIERINRYAVPSGGFAYWPGGNDVHDWTNSYVGHFLVEARKLGFAVNQGLFDQWSKFQTARARQFSTRDASASDYLNQAYRLYTLALAGEAEIGAMNRLRNASQLPSTARYLLAGAYANIGQQQVAGTLISESPDVTDYKEAGPTFGSSTRDRAIIAEVLLNLGQQEKAWPVIRRIAEDIAGDSWYSTQSVAFALRIISMSASRAGQGDLHFVLTENGEKQTVKINKSLFQKQLPIRQTRLSCENPMQTPLYVRVIRSGKPVDPVNKTQQRHLGIQVTYRDVQGKSIDPERLRQGTDFVMAVTVNNPGTFAHELDALALQTILPSGWEVRPQRIDGQSTPQTQLADYQDFRDDAVYTFFDLGSRQAKTYQFALTATYPGRFILPAVQCEAMYDGAVQATVPGKWVEVSRGDQPPVTKAAVSHGN